MTAYEVHFDPKFYEYRLQIEAADEHEAESLALEMVRQRLSDLFNEFFITIEESNPETPSRPKRVWYLRRTD